MQEILESVYQYAIAMDKWEFTGLVFGILAVYFLIKEQVYTWPSGIIYVLASFVVFWNAQLYGDFILHIFFLILNVYGWNYWKVGIENKEIELPIKRLPLKSGIIYLLITFIGIFLFAQFLIYLPSFITDMAPASLPYWDSTTSILSVTGMWLTARKKIDSWYYWLAVDILATGIYFYKELYFYSFLYLIYIPMAVIGYWAWRKTMKGQLKIT